MRDDLADVVERGRSHQSHGGPRWVIGNHQGLLEVGAFEVRFDLLADDVRTQPFVQLVGVFAHAQDRPETMLLRGVELAPHDCVSL